MNRPLEGTHGSKVDKPVAVIAVRRRIETLNDGANAYLLVLIDKLHTAGFTISLVFAPESSFGDRPVTLMARGIYQRCSQIRWSKCLRIGRLAISLSPRVYIRFLRRLPSEWRRICGANMPKAPSRSSQRLPKTEERELARDIDAEAPRLAIMEYSALGGVLRHLSTDGVTRSVLLHDLFAMRTTSMHQHISPLDIEEVSLEQETEDCAGADLLVYASQSERDVMAERLPGKTHHWLAPERPERAAESPGDRPRAVFMGVRHGGNIDALTFLMTEIWPRVIQTVGDAELQVLGDINMALKPEWRRLRGVRPLGVVGDLSRFCGPDAIGLAPTRVASGVSIKIADYLSLGMPVLATQAALTGYGERLKGAVVMADDPAAFAEALVKLLSSAAYRHDIAKQGREAAISGSDNATLLQDLKALAQAGCVESGEGETAARFI